jgi:large repetitive protein
LVNDMSLCDSGNGSADFDLTIPRDEIINGQGDMTATFYLTQAGAEAGTTGQLPLLYTATGGPTTIYVRLEDDITECFTVVTFTIEVVPNPPITFPITDYFECDNDQDGFENFDLTSKESEILGTIPPASVTVTYHNSFADADAGVGEINPATVYNSAGNETIFVRVAYNVDPFCYSVGQFELGLHPPVAFNPPAPLQVCDEGAANGIATFNLNLATTQITGNDANLSVTYHFDQPDADNGVNQLPLMYQNQTPYFQTIWVRVVNLTTGCYGTAPLDLIVEVAPAAFVPDPLTYCDPDNDGFGSFTLTDAENQITGGAIGVDVTYHLTQADADNGVWPQMSPFYNTVQYTQTLYARVSITGIDCYNTVPLVLQVLDTPQLVVPDDMVACDYNGNGTATFDLTLVEPQMMVNITNLGNYSIYYYANATDLANDNPIAVPGAYTNVVAGQQTIYVVVEDDTNGCTTQVEFDLIVVDLPEIFPPTPLELCDVNNPGDEMEEFDLSLATLEITGGDTSITVTYHLTQADADAGTNPIGPLYTNIENNQTIYIRVVSQEGCVITQGYTLTLIVNPLPSPEEPTPLVVCDPNSDGFALFDLDSKIPEILNNEPDVLITFHETLIDALDGTFALTSLYLNVVQYQQVIYVRAENTITGCFTTVELLLLVNDTPDIPLVLDDLVLCSQDQNDIGVIFDLTLQNAAIYGTQDPNDFTLTYHLTEANAQAGTGAIANPSAYANTSNTQTIWVRLVDAETGCHSIGSFELVVNLPPVIAQPADLPVYELCDDEVIDGFTVFDLTYMNPLITMGQPGMEVQYYLSLADAEDQINQIDPDTAFTNTVNPQIIWVRVYDDDTGCDAYTRITLRVNPNPTVNEPDPIALCDTEGTGEQVFDLTIREAQILGGETNVTVSYYLTLAGAEEGDPTNNPDAILDPENYTNTSNPQTIYVRVESTINGCYTIVELLLIVDTLPELEVTDYIICEANNTGFAQFDLTTKITEITSPLPPGNYLVSFHEEAGDELVPQNAIPVNDLPDYINKDNPQRLYVRLTNIDTGCFVTGEFDLIVEEGATATAPAAPLVVCEDEVGSGVGTFDLTQLNGEILNGQAPPDYELSYHESQGDAEAGTNAIPPAQQAAYQSPTQTIWARVTNTETGCYEIVAIELQVIPVPDLVALQESYRICVDEFGNVIPEDFGPTSPPTIDTGLSTPDYIFIWEIDGQIQFNESEGSITATQGGVYTVTVIDSETGCETQASTTVIESSPPITYSVQPVTGAFAGSHAIGATAQGLGDYIFRLDDGPYQDVGYWENVSPGRHTVTITDRNGCGSVTVEVSVIDYPLFFTPNNDGYHDTWNIIGIADNPTAKIYIFDRYGKLLKQLSPTGRGWDGTYNGRPMPSNDYWFRVEYREDGIEKEFRGHFTLKR